MTSSTEQHREAFAIDPENLPAFAALEEQLFMEAEWPTLVAAYRHRLTAASCNDPAVRVPLLLRLAQVLEERCCDLDEAVEAYTEIARLSPSYRPALRQLRTIYARREQWELVLQIAELESQTPMPPHEQAALFASLGEIWRRELLDMGEAMKALRSALEADPEHCGALRSLALTFEALGEASEASVYWERLAQRLRGQERAPVMVALGRLASGPLDDSARAETCYREALEDDPHCIEAVDALLIITCALERWGDLEGLYEQRFDLTSGARRRSAIALEAARLHLDRLEDPTGARVWVNRALDLSPEDPSAHHARAELERAAGDTSALSEALERVIELTDSATPPSVLLDAAELHSAEGREEQAIEYLERVFEKTPADSLVLEALSDSLSRAGRHDRNCEVLELRAGLPHDDLETQVEVLSELGRVYSEDLDDAEAGIETYQRALALQPEARGVATRLERCLRKREDWTGLLALLEQQGELGTPAQQSKTQCALAELLQHQMGDDIAAAHCFERALTLQPDSEQALHGLAGLARASGDTDAIIRICEREASVTRNGQRLTELADELAERLEQADRPADALSWLGRLLEVEPDHRDALERVTSLQERLGLHSELVETLERLDPLQSAPEQAENRRRRATLHSELDRPDQVIQCWQAALAAVPGDLATLRALETHYTEARDWPALADVQRALAIHLPDDERAESLDVLARLLDEQLGDPDGALEVLQQLAERDDAPPDLNPRRAALLERTDRFADLVELLALQRDALPEDSDERWLLDLERSRLLMDRLDDFEAGAAACREVVRAQPGCDEAYERLERAVRLGDDTTALVDLLSDLAERESNTMRRAEREMERAELLEDGLQREEEAIALYTHLCDHSDAPGEITARAQERLERLLERRDDFASLALRREKRLTASNDDPVRLALHEDLASLYGKRLNDRQREEEHLEAAVALAESRDDLWRRLESLYDEQGRDEDCLRALEAQLECDPTPDRELEVHILCARLCKEFEGRSAEAGEHYECALELDRASAEALEYLVAHYEAANRPRDIVRLLELQLAAASDDTDSERRLGLRLRIASLRRDALDDIDSAVAILEPGLGEVGPIGALAEPLAQLYEQGAYEDDLAALCLRAAESASDETSEDDEARWRMRLGNALCTLGRTQEAAEAYAAVLELRPDEADAREPLCALYRELGAYDLLAPQLEITLASRRGDELALRLELSDLFQRRLDRSADALSHLERAVDLAPTRGDLAERTMELAEELGRDETLGRLIDARLTHERSASARGKLLGRRAQLLAGPMERPEDALVDLREALALAPNAELREALRATLERLGRHAELLDCLYAQARAEDGGGRVDWYEQAAEVAAQHVPSAERVWLERLRSERPDDPSIVARLAGIHRSAGRSQAYLRCLEDELSLLGPNDDARSLELALERAQCLEQALDSPARAARALEQARERFPRDRTVLAELDRIYSALQRPHEHLDVIESWLEALEPNGDATQRVALHRRAAALCEMGRSDAGVAHLLHAIALTDDYQTDTSELLTSLLERLKSVGWRDAWCRAAEAWLRACPDDDDERRREVRLELACAYQAVGRNEAALTHYDVLLDDCDEPAGEAAADWRESAELGRMALLRAARRDIELARCLATRARRRGATATEWLELARLEEERLHRPAAAAHAFGEVLKQVADSLPALRGARRCAERLGRWSDVVATLEQELPLLETASERGSVLRALAAIQRDQLLNPSAAAEAFRRALRDAPEDLGALRSLEFLCEEIGEWAEAIDLLEREIELLGEGDPERRREAWLQAGGMARQTDDLERAERAHAEAHEIEDLAAPDLRVWAELQRSLGNQEHFSETFALYCDAPDSDAEASDHVALACVLEALDDREAAHRRIERALELDPHDSAAWDAAARLSRDPDARADALERAAALHAPAEARERLIEAAGEIEALQPERASALLRCAIERDPASATAHARLARVADARGRNEEARDAARRAIDLDAEGSELSSEAALECARVGGRNAAATGQTDAAAGFFARALELSPEDSEALEGSGEALFSLGEFAAARGVLETRLAQDGDHAQRPRHLAMVGCALESEEATDAALDYFDQALAIDATQALAHAGRCRIHESAGRLDDAVAAWVDWSESEPNDESKAQHRIHAAEIELGRGEADAACLQLEAALETDATCAPAAALLAETLWDLDRHDDAFDVASSGAETAETPEEKGRLELVRARALAELGEPAEAEQCYAAVLDVMPGCSEAAETRASLLRGMGDWSAASDVLREFIEARRASSDTTQMARLLCERGRLLAGPLEEVEEAIECFESALALDGELSSAREHLANLQSHLPEHFARAVTHHEILLRDDPTRPASLRALQRIAENSPPSRGMRRTGLTLLRALGIASPQEREAAPEHLDLQLSQPTAPGNPLFERLRVAALHAAEGLAPALRSDAPNLPRPTTAFMRELTEAETELSAEALRGRSDTQLRECFEALLALAVDDVDSVPLAREIELHLSRRARRKLRRALEGTSAEDLESIDFALWREELQEIAASTALERCGGDLRGALIDLCRSDETSEDDKDQDVSPTADITSRVAGSPAARNLLGRAVLDWCAALSGTL